MGVIGAVLGGRSVLGGGRWVVVTPGPGNGCLILPRLPGVARCGDHATAAVAVWRFS